MVAPERETPGIRASDWAKPSRMPCRQVEDSSGRSLRAKWSAMPMTRPNPPSMAAVIHRFRSEVSISSWKNSPSTTIGIEPMITSQPIRASKSSRGTLPTRDPAHRVMINQMSRRK